MTDDLSKYEALDASRVPRFAGLSTFMRHPHVADPAELDIALVGVPFDLGILNRSGARQGPAQIREMSRLIRRVNPSSNIMPSGICKIGDIGDAPINPLNLHDSIDKITTFYADLHGMGVIPISAGGDHLITLPILRGIVHDGPVGMVHFDAHADTFDELFGEPINNGTPFRRAVEEELIDPKRVIQIGMRGTRYSEDDLKYSYDTGMRVVTMDDYEEMGRKAVIEEIRRVIGDKPAYVTYDVDGLDPVHCPGTGVPEPGGLSMRDSQVMLRGLQGLSLIGGDVCEVCPPLDPEGHTAINAANLMFEILCVVADSVARNRG